MKASLLRTPAPIESNPLQFADVARPVPAEGEALIRVRMCGVCRTDLHVIEGELPPRKSPVIPGHQVVGVVDKLGEGSHSLCDRSSCRRRLAAPYRRLVRILPQG